MLTLLSGDRSHSSVRERVNSWIPNAVPASLPKQSTTAQRSADARASGETRRGEREARRDESSRALTSTPANLTKNGRSGLSLGQLTPPPPNAIDSAIVELGLGVNLARCARRALRAASDRWDREARRQRHRRRINVALASAVTTVDPEQLAGVDQVARVTGCGGPWAIIGTLSECSLRYHLPNRS